jgi:hypothetical protein
MRLGTMRRINDYFIFDLPPWASGLFTFVATTAIFLALGRNLGGAILIGAGCGIGSAFGTAFKRERRACRRDAVDG